MVGMQQVATFGCRDGGDEVLPPVREDPVRPLLIEPADLRLAAQKDAAQHQGHDPFRVGLGIGQGQGRAPGATEHHPALDAQGGTDALAVGHQIPGGVVDEVGVGRGTSAAALVEQDDAIAGRIKETPVPRLASGPWTAMQKDHGDTLGIAGFLDVEAVALATARRRRA